MTTLFSEFEAFIERTIARRTLGGILMGLVILYLLIMPYTPGQSNYTKLVFISAFFYAILASSWAFLAGISGQFSFGHMAFMGIGAYTAGLLARDGFALPFLNLQIAPESFSPVGAILIGMLVAGFAGLVVGALVLRLRSSYLALFTIAFSELFRLVIVTEFDYTGGMNGLSLRRLFVGDTVDAARNMGYYTMFFLLVASLIIMYIIANSRVGLFLRAMREDEDAASALGVNIVFYKIIIFVITSLIVGLAGGVFYSNVGAERITPETLEILQMALVIAFAVVGGMESLLGAAVGAFVARYLLEALRVIPLPVTFVSSFEFSVWVVTLGVAALFIGVAIYIALSSLRRHPNILLRILWGVMLAVAIMFASFMLVVLGNQLRTTSIVFEPSRFEPQAWRYAIFGVIMVLTLRFARNGLLFPILQWFGGRSVMQRETVSKRDAGAAVVDPGEEEIP